MLKLILIGRAASLISSTAFLCVAICAAMAGREGGREGGRESRRAVGDVLGAKQKVPFRQA
jgi:hypothetical protein